MNNDDKKANNIINFDDNNNCENKKNEEEHNHQNNFNDDLNNKNENKKGSSIFKYNNLFEQKSKVYDSIFFILFHLVGGQIILALIINLFLSVAMRNSDELAKTIVLNIVINVLLAVGYITYILVRKLGKPIFVVESKKQLIFAALIGVSAFFAILIINVILSSISSSIYKLIFNKELENSDNQTLIESMFPRFSFLLFIMTVILAPFVEEIAYRLGLCSSISRKHPIIGIFISGFIFGLIHFNFMVLIPSKEGNYLEHLVSELLNFPNYFVSGLVFGFIYKLSGTIYSSWISHFVNNLFSFFAMYVLYKLEQTSSSSSTQSIQSVFTYLTDNSSYIFNSTILSNVKNIGDFLFKVI